MNIYVYSDESGVFDKEHNDYFVFGGLILLGTEEKENWSRKYSSVEKVLRKNKGVDAGYELKATQITNGEKGKLFRSLNGCYKFGVVIREKDVLERIYQSKKDKQRYLDYAYKIAVKRAFKSLICDGIINPDETDCDYTCVRAYADGLLLVERYDGKYGLVNTNGKVLAEFAYDSIEIKDHGTDGMECELKKASSTITVLSRMGNNSENTRMYINTSGEVVFSWTFN